MLSVKRRSIGTLALSLSVTLAPPVLSAQGEPSGASQASAPSSGIVSDVTRRPYATLTGGLGVRLPAPPSLARVDVGGTQLAGGLAYPFSARVALRAEYARHWIFRDEAYAAPCQPTPCAPPSIILPRDFHAGTVALEGRKRFGAAARPFGFAFVGAGAATATEDIRSMGRGTTAVGVVGAGVGFRVRPTSDRSVRLEGRYTHMARESFGMRGLLSGAVGLWL